MTIATADADETYAVAARLGQLLAPGDLVLLQGPLGAGKTHFVRGLCAGMGFSAPWEVDSPTYTVVNHYEVGPGVDHIDLYRLAGSGDLDEIGLDEILASDTVKLIEWPERLGGYPIPRPAFTVHIDIQDAERRRIRLFPAADHE